jgi:uncharacterized protein YndB with AHSA1/START domain
MSDNTFTNDAIVVERIFDVPAALIWQLWTEPEHIRNWYGPQGFTVSVTEMDLRVGGHRLFCMEMQTADNSRPFWTTGEFREIVPNERLVYTDIPSNENGDLLSLADLGMGEDDSPFITLVTVLLEDLGGRTKMVVTHSGVPANDEGAQSGWQQAMEKMANYIETVRSK